MSKYVKVPHQSGIWKNTSTKKYMVTKKIKGKQFAETFDSIRQAQHWKHTFNGERKQVEVTDKTSTLGFVWQRMQVLHFPSRP